MDNELGKLRCFKPACSPQAVLWRVLLYTISKGKSIMKPKKSNKNTGA
jgi:hypothetical protein